MAVELRAPLLINLNILFTSCEYRKVNPLIPLPIRAIEDIKWTYLSCCSCRMVRKARRRPRCGKVIRKAEGNGGERPTGGPFKVSTRSGRKALAQAPTPLQPQWLKFELAKTASIWALGQ